jgi:hypothetical protein
VIFDYLTLGVVGPLIVGMPRSDVRSLLGDDFITFKKTAEALNTTDAFDGHELHVYYDESDTVKGVEFFKGSSFLWKGTALAGEIYAKVKECFSREGVDFSIDSYGVYADKLGMEFYIPDIDDEGDNSTVESLYLDLTVS